MHKSAEKSEKYGIYRVVAEATLFPQFSRAFTH